ncbi:M48 family metalloprotease [Actinomadura flavalba]|uniref:M48 family metalloprotease n=1 Tax=Actinomadura flavalba TaxID=1120938 RepID=UPI000368AB6E|nr:M48 family metalloprotease [Actinomadura flavalba]
MTVLTFAPAFITLVLAAFVGVLPPPLHPVWSARLLAIVAVTTALAVLGTAGFVGVNYLAGLDPAATAWLPEWALFGDDRPLPAVLGVPALALTAAGVTVAAVRSARWRREIRAARRDARTVVGTDEPVALAVPGRDGGVLVSRGLLALLTRDELRVVFEHERCHLRHRHHRYLAAGALSAAVLPPLRPLDRRLRFTVERWADEAAAEAVGDRALVARTIARVALNRAPGALPAFAGNGVPQRVQALLSEPPGKNPVTGPVTVVSTGATTTAMASAAFQLDRAIGFILL